MRMGLSNFSINSAGASVRTALLAGTVVSCLEWAQPSPLPKNTNKLEINKVKILKLEAEGFEPEILRGAGDRLKDIEYIAIDGGYERGISEEETFTTLTNFLIKKNFQILDIYFPWYRGLFKNSNF